MPSPLISAMAAVALVEEERDVREASWIRPSLLSTLLRCCDDSGGMTGEERDD